MNLLSPIFTSHPLTGAERPVTIDLLRETYLVPIVEPADIGNLITHLSSPWSESFVNAPRETTAAVSDALSNLIRATRRVDPSEIDTSKIEPGTRLRIHVEALLQLWQAIGDALPINLQVMRHVIRSDGLDVLENLPIVNTYLPKSSIALENELYKALVRHHGFASKEAEQVWQERYTKIYRGAKDNCSLGRAQSYLLGTNDEPLLLDKSLMFWGVRDLAEEAELAAAISQKFTNQGILPQDIGILLPDDPSYQLHLRRAFTSAGVPISGLTDEPPSRDITTETLLHFILALNVPAPAMVLASLYISPLMPWPPETGALLAREVMKGRYEPRFTKEFEGKSERLFRTLRDQRDKDTNRVSAQLDLLTQCLTDNEKYRENIFEIRAQVTKLKAHLVEQGRPNWEKLLEHLNPKPSASPAIDRFVEGVSVFSEKTLPWRSTKHLIVLGTNASRYPRATSASPMFLDSELERLEKLTGLHLPGRSEQLSIGLEIFRRQLSIASETCTFLYPFRELDGSRQSISTSLALIARSILDSMKDNNAAVEDPTTLIRDIRLLPHDEWPCAFQTIRYIDQGIERQMPSNNEIILNRDLFDIRLDSDGTKKPQTPSRLEKLMISPLAWTLSEFDAEELIWAPETYDHILSGTLAHDVLEHLFQKESPLPTDSEINANTARLLDNAIRKYAPFLNSLLWKVERQGLERTIIRDAKKWRLALETMNAKIVDNEINLYGHAHGLDIFGRADCLLKLNDGRIIIVDHKKSSSKSRRERMEAGWDLQLGLYRSMLLRPSLKDGVLKNLLLDKPEIGVAYHLINDSGILINGIEISAEGIEIIDNAISVAAIERLEKNIAEVSTGTIRLNLKSDLIFFDKEAKITPYALKESTLISAFLVSSDTDEDNEDE